MNKTKLRVGLISSFVPKKCGIATYSRDLINAIEKSKEIDWCLVAAEDPNDSYSYKNKTIAIIKKDSLVSYRKAVKALNDWNPDVVLLQHEYGLFGGKAVEVMYHGEKHHSLTGDYILELVNGISAPIITTFHTILPRAGKARSQVLKDISNRSSKIVAMTKNAKTILRKNYDIENKHIAVIPHGVPRPTRKKRATICKELSLDQDRYYLLTTGLIGPNKGIDTIVRALPKIIKSHPEVVLLVVGQTHPNILAVDGEKYRNSLVDLAKELKVSDHLQFVNEYLSTDKLVDYFTIADVYFTIHKDPGQSASGTLAYALGCGLVAISTPYRYAKEVLSNGGGILVPFDSSVAIAKNVNNLIENPELSQKIKKKAMNLGKRMGWKMVGKSYLKIIEDVIEK